MKRNTLVMNMNGKRHHSGKGSISLKPSITYQKPSHHEVHWKKPAPICTYAICLCFLSAKGDSTSINFKPGRLGIDLIANAEIEVIISAYHQTNHDFHRKLYEGTLPATRTGLMFNCEDFPKGKYQLCIKMPSYLILKDFVIE